MKHLVNTLLTADAFGRVEAAVELGHLGGNAARDHLLAALAKEEQPQAFAAICAGLELIGDRSIVAELERLLPLVPDNCVGELTHCLSSLRSYSPYVQERADATALRRAWLEDLADGPTPQPQLTTAANSHGVALKLHGGSGRIRIDFDPAPRGTTNWPRFMMSLWVGDQQVYATGSWCPTCELWLTLCGWPPREAHAVNNTLAATVQSQVKLNDDWLQAWLPILGELRSGDYQATTLTLDLTCVDEPAASYFNSRMDDRQSDDPWYDDGHDEPGEPSLPGTPFYQGPRLLQPYPTYWVVMPSQPVEALDAATVAAYESAILEGERPTIVTLAWVDSRTVVGEFEERFVVHYVLDGHHKLQAYANLNEPAELVSIFIGRSRSDEVLRQVRSEIG